MSLEIEIGFARLAAALGGPAMLLSAEGVGSPLAAATAAPLIRSALRPSCGLRRDPALWLPPSHWSGAAPPDVTLLVDARSEEPALLDAPAHALRGFRARAGMRLVRSDPETGEGLWLAPDAWRGHVENPARECDEFDALRRFLGAGLVGLRHGPGEAQVGLDPLQALDAPDERQTDEALGGGRAVADASGLMRLAIPDFGRARFGLTLTGIAADAPRPRVISPSGVRAEISRDGPLWTLEAHRTGRGEAFRLVLQVPGPDVELSALWITARRRRAHAELWDEAEAVAAAEPE